MTWATYTSHALTGGDISANSVIVSGAAPLASGTYYFRSRLVRGGLISVWSNSVSDAVIVAAAAPTSLVDISPAPDTTPDFVVGLQVAAGNETDARIGDICIGEYSSNGGANWAQGFSHTLINADIVAGTFNVSSSVLGAGDYLYRARLQRSTVFSPYSANVPVTVVAGSNQPSTVYVRSLLNKSEVSQGNMRLRAQADKG